ncbi:MAG: hypothetical protein ACI30J_06415, partial [Paludibacteraceae bacterium]
TTFFSLLQGCLIFREDYKDLRFVTDEEIDRDMFPDSFVREYNAYFAGRAAETAPETTDEISPAEAKQQQKTHSVESAEEEWIDL